MRLYDPFIERDLEAIPAAVRQFRQEHSSIELWEAVSRFAVLAYAPSQHAKHAVLSCLAAFDLREALGSRFDEVITECAIYSASSRPPWSEPPILEPPPLEPDAPRGIEELRQAVAAGDALRAERWLAARLDDSDFSRDYFAVAAEDPDDLGHKLIVAVAAFRLAALLGEKGRFAALRIGIREMVAYRGPAVEAQPFTLGSERLASRLSDRMISERGEVLAAHRLFLFDAALQSEEPAVIDRVSGALEREDSTGGERHSSIAKPSPGVAVREVAVYRLARDYGELLKTCAVSGRLAARFPEIAGAGLIAAAAAHLEESPSSDELTFA